MARLSPTRSKDPHLTRVGIVSHPGPILLGMVAIVFTAYALGYLPQVNEIFDRLTKSSHDEGLSIVAPILFGLASLFALVLVLLALRSIGRLFRTLERIARFTGRAAISLQSFAKCAETQGISTRVSHETYRALTPHYPSKMCIHLQDHLRRHLHLSEENILFIQSNILNRCDRREVLFFSADGLETVLDLMRHVESAPRQHVRETDASEVGGDGTTRGRRGGDRLPTELLERRALPADGGLHGAPVPGRRRGDFCGVRRRSRDLPRPTLAGLLVPLATKLPEDGLPESKPAYFHPRSHSTDFEPRRRGDPPAQKPEE